MPYARRKSNIGIKGNAWTWWKSARGRFRRAARPAVGAVLVFKRNRRSRGHLAVVEGILDNRVIVVSHANWLNRGRIHLNTPVRDVSKANDWSAVRVWHTPTGQYGSATYRTHGFIHAEDQAALARDVAIR